MKNKFFIIVELIILLIAIFFAFLWIKYPEKNYEPYTVVPGLISGILEVIRRLLSKGKDLKTKISLVDTQENKQIDNTFTQKISNITVNEIVDNINNSAPFLKEEISKKYNGIRIKWIGYLKSADLVGKDKVRVNCNVEKDSIIGKSFWFTEDINNIPELRTLPKESKICVVGNIISASGPGISVTIEPVDIKVIRDI